jgi:hypothetical protein
MRRKKLPHLKHICLKSTVSGQRIFKLREIGISKIINDFKNIFKGNFIISFHKMKIGTLVGQVSSFYVIARFYTAFGLRAQKYPNSIRIK